VEALPLYSVCVALHEGRLQSTVESGVPPPTARTRARCSRCGLWRQYIGDTGDRSSPQRSALWSLPLHFLTIVISAVRIPRDPPPPLAAQSAWVSEEGALAARYDFSSEEGTFHPSGPWVLHHSHFISSHQLSSALIHSSAAANSHATLNSAHRRLRACWDQTRIFGRHRCAPQRQGWLAPGGGFILLALLCSREM